VVALATSRSTTASAAPGSGHPSGLHTSYALQSGYEPLLRQLGKVPAQDLDQLSARLTMAGDTRDVLAARDGLRQLLNLSLLDQPGG